MLEGRDGLRCRVTPGQTDKEEEYQAGIRTRIGTRTQQTEGFWPWTLKGRTLVQEASVYQRDTCQMMPVRPPVDCVGRSGGGNLDS